MADFYKRWDRPADQTVIERYKDMGAYHAKEVYLAGGSIGGTTKDDGPAWASLWGVGNAPVVSVNMSGAPAAVIDAPGAGLCFVLSDIVVTGAQATLFTFTEETSGLVLAYASVGANGTAQVTLRSKRRTVTAAHRVMCQTDVAGNVSVLVGGYTEV